MTPTFAARMDYLSAEMLLTPDTLDRILVEVEREIAAALRAEITATNAAALAVQDACDKLRADKSNS